MRMMKRLQVLVRPEQMARLQRESEKRGTSVGELIREAVDRAFPDDQRARDRAYERIIRANLPVEDWSKMKRRLLRNRTRSMLKGMR